MQPEGAEAWDDAESDLAILSCTCPNLHAVIHSEPPRNAEETRAAAREELAQVMALHREQVAGIRSSHEAAPALLAAARDLAELKGKLPPCIQCLAPATQIHVCGLLYCDEHGPSIRGAPMFKDLPWAPVVRRMSDVT